MAKPNPNSSDFSHWEEADYDRRMRRHDRMFALLAIAAGLIFLQGYMIAPHHEATESLISWCGCAISSFWKPIASLKTALLSARPPFALTQSAVFQENLMAAASVISSSYTLYAAKNFKTDSSYSVYANRGSRIELYINAIRLRKLACL
jgi:hypothetical protein